MTARHTRRGGPLVMLAMLVAVWIGGRAMTWENPFSAFDLNASFPSVLIAQSDHDHTGMEDAERSRLEQDFAFANSALESVEFRSVGGQTQSGIWSVADAERFSTAVQAGSLGHQMLWMTALGSQIVPRAERASIFSIGEPRRTNGFNPASPTASDDKSPDRWSFDLWGFWREGSNAAPISQGRVPIYGASQIGAKLDWRARPSSKHDPRLFARAYRALVTNGETEIAAGASARPISKLPVRVSAEVRVTERRFGTDIRPAVYATTELPPQSLPLEFNLEAYGGAGYVGGNGATAFVDGQASVTREFADFEGPVKGRTRLSLGAAAWGGAQRDASRVDVGPTLRLDMTLGEIPARLSVDWREQVGGEAAPDSGFAATLSTRF